MLRVAVLSRAVFPLHGHGGLERHTGDLVRYLAARGVSVTLLTRTPRRGAAPFSVPNVDLVTIPYRTFPLAGRRGTTVIDRSTSYLWFGRRLGRLAADLARAGQIDIVYGLGAAALGYAQARHPRPPFVFNPQGLEEFGGPDARFGGSTLKRIGYMPLRRAVRTCARAADCVIATDRALESVVQHHLGIGPGAIRTIPNAIALETCGVEVTDDTRASLRRKTGAQRDDLVFLSAGRLERNKGLHVMIEALQAVRDLPWRWVVVGDGPYRARLHAAARTSGIAGRITFLGRVEDRRLHEWYETADLFVHPTLYEGSSLVTLEAMAHRLPVVATEAGGLPDKVRPGVNGWLVSPGNPTALAEAIRHAVEERAAFERLGRAGRAIVEREFSWDVVTGQMLALFAELHDARAR